MYDTARGVYAVEHRAGASRTLDQRSLDQRHQLEDAHAPPA